MSQRNAAALLQHNMRMKQRKFLKAAMEQASKRRPDLFFGKDTVQNIAKDLCNIFHQESVLVTVNQVNGFFIVGGNDS